MSEVFSMTEINKHGSHGNDGGTSTEANENTERMADGKFDEKRRYLH